MVHPLVASRSVAESALSRRSIRRFTEAPISDAEIWEILRLAGCAPSAWNSQPWRFIAVRDSETKTRLWEAANQQPQVASAPVVIVLTSDMEDAIARVDDWLHPNLAPERRERSRASILRTFAKMTLEERSQWGRNQANIALGYLLLVLESLGYGSSPMLGFDPEKVRRLFDLPDHVEIAALVAFGRPDEMGHEPHRHDARTLAKIL